MIGSDVFPRSESSFFDEDSSERPVLVPSYEPGGGLWFFWPKSGALQKLPYTVNRVVDESPLMDQGYVFHGRKVVKLMALDPIGGAVRWIHDDDSEVAPKAGRARSNPFAQQESFLISRVEYTLYTTNAETGKLRSKVSISDLALLGLPDEAGHGRDQRVIPVILTEQYSNGEWGVACLDRRNGAILWRRPLPSQAVCGFFWDRNGVASVPLHSREQFVEAAMNGAMNGVSSDAAIAVHRHKDSLFILPVPELGDLSPLGLGDRGFEKSAALALISSRQAVQHQLLPAGDGRWQSPRLDGCVGRDRPDVGACIAGVYRISAADQLAGPPIRSGQSPAQERPFLIGPGQDEGPGGPNGARRASRGAADGADGAWYLYYAVAGVMVWPALAWLVWLLATHGPRTRVQLWVTAWIDWAHSRLHQAEARTPPPPGLRDSATGAESADGGDGGQGTSRASDHGGQASTVTDASGGAGSGDGGRDASPHGGQPAPWAEDAAGRGPGEVDAPGTSLRPQCAVATAAAAAKGAFGADARAGGVVSESPTSGTEHTWSKAECAEAEADGEVSGATSWGSSSRSESDDGCGGGGGRRGRPVLAIPSKKPAPAAASKGKEAGEMDILRQLDEEAMCSKVGRQLRRRLDLCQKRPYPKLPVGACSIHLTPSITRIHPRSSPSLPLLCRLDLPVVASDPRSIPSFR